MSVKLLVTGGDGLLGYALREICPQATFVTRKDADLTDLREVKKIFTKYKPESVIHLAAKVGGVKSNALYNAEYFSENIQINTNVLSEAHTSGVEKLISVLSTCAYRVYEDRPSTEEDLHVDSPFKGNRGYGYAKRMLDVHTKLLHEQYGCFYTTITPVTMYGPRTRLDIEDGHVVEALIHKCFLAKKHNKPLEVWGTGNAIRQFVYSLDVAKIILELLNSSFMRDPETLIIVPDKGITIKELVQTIAEIMEFKGPILFDTSKPEGQHVRVMRSHKCFNYFPHIAFTSLKDGLKKTIQQSYIYYRYLDAIKK